MQDPPKADRRDDEDEDEEEEDESGGEAGGSVSLSPSTGRGGSSRRKINIEYINDRNRRHITFSKRKAGLMKKAHELSVLTGAQVLLIVASDTNHVYTFVTPKLRPIVNEEEGRTIVQACLAASPSSVPGPEISGVDTHRHRRASTDRRHSNGNAAAAVNAQPSQLVTATAATSTTTSSSSNQGSSPMLHQQQQQQPQLRQLMSSPSSGPVPLPTQSMLAMLQQQQQPPQYLQSPSGLYMSLSPNVSFANPQQYQPMLGSGGGLNPDMLPYFQQQPQNNNGAIELPRGMQFYQPEIAQQFQQMQQQAALQARVTQQQPQLYQQIQQQQPALGGSIVPGLPPTH